MPVRLVAGRPGPIVDVYAHGFDPRSGVGSVDAIHRPALDASRNATIAWTSSEGARAGAQQGVEAGPPPSAPAGAPQGVQVRALSASGALGPIVDVPTPGAFTFFPAVGIGATGDAVVAWGDHARPDRLLARTASAATGRIGPAIVVWAGTKERDRVVRQSIAVAAGSGDAAIVSWTNSPRYVHSAHDRPQARVLSADGRLGPLLTLAGRGPDPWARAGVTPDGHAVLAWRRGGSPVLEARTLTLAGALGPAVRVAQVGSRREPGIAVAGAGTAVFAWKRGGHVVARSLSASGALGHPATLSGHDTFIEHVQAAAAGRGGMVAWDADLRPRLRAVVARGLTSGVR